MITKLKNFFREDLSEVVGAYFDGEKIFVTRQADKFETVEIEADGFELEHIAEKISLVCRQKGWKNSLIGFCLREEDAVTFQMEAGNVPEKEIPAMVKIWAAAQADIDAVFSFTKVGAEFWMETLPRAKFEEICAAFKKFNLNLRGLSVMPADMLTKVSPFDRTKFIAEVIRNKKSPNLLSTRDSAWNWKKISLATAAIFFIALIIGSAKIFFDYSETSAQLDAAKISIDEFRDDLALKENLNADIADLHKLNKICAAQNVNPKNFNLLINLGKIAGGGVRLIEIHIDEKSLVLEGSASTSDAVKSYLSRVKNFVAQSARFESSKENDDGDILFKIRANF